MKHINKGVEPASLSLWRQGQIAGGMEPAYGDLQNPQKNDCRESLLAEQGSICCYCGRKIAQGAMHIEHFVPQSVDASLDTIWENLLGCCAPQNAKGAAREQIHCGEFRGDLALGVSPLDPGCETRFCYHLMGEISPQVDGDLGAEQTVANLNLNAERLRAGRSELIEEAYEQLESLSGADWLAVYVEPDSNGKFHDFTAMLRWFYEASWQKEQQLLQEVE